MKISFWKAISIAMYLKKAIPKIVKDKKVLAARAYHGILLSEQDETGEFFWRGGQKCRLFTHAFLKKWKAGILR